MAALSKHYADIVQQLNCAEVFHPGRNCWNYAGENFGKIFQLCVKFYTPMVLAQFARSAKTIDANTVREFLQMLLQLTFSTYMGSAVGQSLSCVFYQSCGFRHPLLLVFIPAFIGNTWGFIAPKRVYNLVTNGLWTMIFEAFYRLDDVPILSLINRSALVRTLMFMQMSRFILDTKVQQKSDVFWFIRPAAVRTKDDDSSSEPRPCVPSPIMDRLVHPGEHAICEHSKSCDMHIYQGALVNFKVGLGIEVVRLLLSNLGLLKRKPWLIAGKLFDIKTGLIVFLVGYTTAYRTAICALNRYQKRLDERVPSWAAFVAGSAFAMYPNFTILAHASISSIKLMWLRLMSLTKNENGTGSSSKIAECCGQLDRLPLGKLFYILSVGVTFHLRTFYPWMCPNILMNAVQYTSGMNADQCMLRFSEFLLGFKKPASQV